jgi:2-haloacid dehalogenase
MPPAYVFDVNETLLDLGALDPLFERAFGDPAAREAWFQQLIQSALVTIATGRYHQFGTIAKATLETTAAGRGVTLDEADSQAILQGISQLPPHPEVPAALGRLRDRGLRLAALTNSTRQVAQTQLANAGLAELFEQILSADQVGRLKPAPEPTRWPLTPWPCRSGRCGWSPRTAGTSPARWRPAAGPRSSRVLVGCPTRSLLRPT